MADPTPLIIKKIEFGMLASAPRPHPNSVFVVSYTGGGLKTFRRGPGVGDRTGSRWCYVVDVSERFSSGELTIPARGDVFFFQVWFDAGWQVSDAETIVRNNIEYGEPVVAGFLSDALWRRGRDFDPDDVRGAEDEIVRSIRPPLALGSGLTLTALNVRLALDTRRATAGSEVADEAHVGQLQVTRMQRLRQMVDGDESVLLLHLTQHPGDTGTVLQMLTQARERNDQLRLGLLDRMLERGFIQDADIGRLRDSILGGSGAPALTAGSSAGWSQPALDPPGYHAPPRTGPPIPTPAPGAPVTPRPDPFGPQDRPATSPDPGGPAPDEGGASGDNVAGWRSLRDRRPPRRPT